MPESEDAGGCRGQGCQEPDRVLQPEHDGSLSAGPGKPSTSILSEYPLTVAAQYKT
jgi:hypothetical protein